MHFKTLRFLQITAKHQYCPVFTRISNHSNISRYLHTALTDCAETSKTSGRLLKEKALVNDFGRTVPSAEKFMASFRCHCNHDQNKFSSLSSTAVVVIFPNLSVNGDVVYVQTWEGLILKNPNYCHTKMGSTSLLAK